MAEYQQWIFNYATGIVELQTGDRRCSAYFLTVRHETTWGSDWITANIAPHFDTIKLEHSAIYCGYDRLHVDTIAVLRPPETLHPCFAVGFMSLRTIRRSHELNCLIRAKSPLQGTIHNAGIISPSITVTGHQHKR